MKTLDVLGCNTCPFLAMIRVGRTANAYCALAQRGFGKPRRDDWSTVPALQEAVPSWCPLLNGPAACKLAVHAAVVEMP